MSVRTNYCVQPCESRTLLAAAAIVTEGILSVTGDVGDDVIRVRYKGPQLIVDLNLTRKTFPKAIVQSVEVSLNDGDDQLTASPDMVRMDALGGAGNDRITGGDAADHLSGGLGRDTLDGAGGDDNLNGGSDADQLEGGGGNDQLNGGTTHDQLRGGDGDDSLNGAAGNDILYWDAGLDVLIGGDGLDRVDFVSAPEGVRVDLSDDAPDGVPAELDTLDRDSIEYLAGTRFDDYLKPEDLPTTGLLGRGGDDKLIAAGSACNVTGDAGQDTLVSGLGADLLDGGSGKDIADYSQRVNDLYIALDNQMNDDGEEGEHDDVRGVETLYCGSGDDWLNGNLGNDYLYGSGGFDHVDGSGGVDTAKDELNDVQENIELIDRS